MRKNAFSSFIRLRIVFLLAVLTGLLFPVSICLGEADEGLAVKFNIFPDVCYLSDGSSVYDSEYVSTMPVNVSQYDTVLFSVYYQSPAVALVYDADMNVLDILESQEYGQVLTYALSDGAYYLRVPVKRAQLDRFSIRGYKGSAPKAAVHQKRYTDIAPNGELPLQSIIHDGGMAKIFRTIGVVGDSLSSGAMTYNVAGDESRQKNIDMYEYSWIQYMARYCGSTAYNFSVSGMGTDTFFGSSRYELLTDGEHLCQAYFIALGHNDWNRSVPIGAPEDMDVEHWQENADTFIGNYAKIISTIKSIQPDAKIFPILMKREQKYADYNEAIRYVASRFDNIYLLEMDKFAEERQGWEDTLGHGNTMGYLNYSYQISSYVDWIIRHNPDEFKYVQFIGTEYGPALRDVEQR